MKVNPQGEWNNSKIIFDNGHVEHWLNGQKDPRVRGMDGRLAR